MNNSDNLSKARKEKKDEFYTQYEDIEKELSHYTELFYGKTVLCNCDDPEWSNFWKYFKDNFNLLKLKKLISTHYEQDKPTYVLEMTQTGVFRRELQGNGDFRSKECLSILNEADIVCTNPPFSLFREFINTLVTYDKKFLIIGNMNSSSCKDVFPLFKEGKVWYGVTILSGDREFRVPDDYPLEASGYRTDAEGNKYIRVKGVRWFTNLCADIKRPSIVPCDEDISQYERYLNYDAIEVGSIKKIPKNYKGKMGVAITFLDKEYSDDYEIIGSSDSLAEPLLINGKQKKNPQRFYLEDNGNPKRLYERIVVRAKRKP